MQLVSVGTEAEPAFASDHKVRLAVEADIPALIEMGRALHTENGLMPFSRQKALEMAWRFVRQQGAICGVIGPVGAPEAMIALTVGQYWYTDEQHLEELFNYVLPEYRKSTRAKVLLEYAKKCARELKRPLLIGVLSQKQTQAKIRLYNRLLGEPAGAYWLYGGKTGI